MSGIGGWLGTGASVIVIGLCWILMKYGHNLPAFSHPWQHRLVIVLMYCAGAALVVTTVGAWVLHALNRVAGFAGGTAPESGWVWALVTVGALSLFAAVVVALIWVPDIGVAYIAVATPLVLALTAGGIAHQIYTATAYPAQSAVSQIGTWAGG